MAGETFSILNKTKSPIPRTLFSKLKKDVLGASFELSLVFLTPSQAQALNKKVRKKDTPFNVLSFSLTATSGELFLCPSVARMQAHQYEATGGDFLTYLFIHGMLHIKGFEHGVTMEKRERHFLRRCRAMVCI